MSVVFVSRETTIHPYICAQTSTLPKKQKSVKNANGTTCSVLGFMILIYRGLILLTTRFTQSNIGTWTGDMNAGKVIIAADVE